MTIDDIKKYIINSIKFNEDFSGCGTNYEADIQEGKLRALKEVLEFLAKEEQNVCSKKTD